MTDREDELAHLRGLQAKHRKNIRMLEEMLANYGMERPLPLLNNLEFEREQLAEVEARLAALARGGTKVAEKETPPTVTATTGDIRNSTMVTAGRDATVDQRQVSLHFHPTEAEAQAARRMAQLETAEHDYLRALQVACNALPLAALSDEGDPHRSAAITLDRVYIELDTTTTASPEGEGRRRPKAQADEQVPDWLTGLRGEARPLAALEAAATESHLVITGEPGSGKSTFVSHLAYLLAGRRLNPDFPLPEAWPHGGQMPIRVLLRDLAPTLPTTEEVDCLPAEACATHLSDAVGTYMLTLPAQLGVPSAASVLETALRRGECLVVFDGLDEVPPDWRRLARMAVEAFAHRHPDNHFLVTCRVRSYQGMARLSGFAEVTLAPFNDEKIEDFVQAWYVALADLGQMTHTQAKTRADNLHVAVQPLAELAQNPLLLTTMAVVHTAQVELPRERAKLYRRCVGVLLSRWQKHKAGQMPILTELGVSESELLAALWEVAYEAHASGEPGEATDLPKSIALKLLARHLGGSYAKAERFLDHVDQRAGLLVSRGGVDEPVYTFPHRTFQEYLAGCHLAVGKRGEFGRHLRGLLAEGDRWALAARLGAEHLLYNVCDVNKVLDTLYLLCPVAELGDEADWRGVVWAGAWTTEVGSERVRADTGDPDGGETFLARLTPRLVTVLERGLLSPSERAAAGDALARLGDPRPGVGLREDDLPDIVWCEVPAGSFLMGSDKTRDPEAYDDELPQHEVILSDYAISKYPVTNPQYAAFVQDGGYTEKWRNCWTEAGWQWKGDRTGPETYGGVFDLPNHPVVMVTWYEAMAFCRWLTERLREAGGIGSDQEVTLPIEAQWEKAARGEDGRAFPWGDEFDSMKCNMGDTGIGSTSAVGIFPAGASPYGVRDMSGNVWEWCRTKWRSSYRSPADESLEGDAPRVLRGGVFYSGVRYGRCAARYWLGPLSRWYGHGFRVVMVAPGFPSGL